MIFHLDEGNVCYVIAQYNVPYIVMHMRGTPQTMQSLTTYIKRNAFYFSNIIAKARSLGINDLIIDPGFGFQNIDQNYEVLRHLNYFRCLTCLF
jgi:dihydropteroate synthase